MSEKHINSMSFVYAQIIEDEIKKDDPDKETILKMCKYIKQYCQTVAYPKGETPEHLKEHLIKEGSKAKGTVTYKGKTIPKSAYEIAKKKEKD